MGDPVFIAPAAAFGFADITAVTGVAAPAEADDARIFDAVAALGRAGPRDVALWTDRAEAGATRAGACFVAPPMRRRLPAATVALVTEHPARAFARLIAFLHPEAARPGSACATLGISRAAFIHPDARLEDDVTVDPGVVVGPRAEIGSGTVLGANSVIGPEVRIGRNCAIGAQVTIGHALVGNAVIIHPGVRIGQSGLEGHGVALGRVIIQDGVEIGANAAVDRGSLGDTVLGEGCRVAGLVHVAADIALGRQAFLGPQAVSGLEMPSSRPDPATSGE